MLCSAPSSQGGLRPSLPCDVVLYREGLSIWPQGGLRTPEPVGFPTWRVRKSGFRIKPKKLGQPHQGARRTNPEAATWLESWRFSPTPSGQGVGRGARICFNHPWPKIRSILSLKSVLRETSKGWGLPRGATCGDSRSVELTVHRAWQLPALSPDPALLISPIWVFLSYILLE